MRRTATICTTLSTNSDETHTCSTTLRNGGGLRSARQRIALSGCVVTVTSRISRQMCDSAASTMRMAIVR